MTTLSGEEFVSSGQTVSGVTVVKGGGLWVESGGTALRTTLLEGAMVVGGRASGTIVGGSGYVSVGGGGGISRTTIENGGRVEVAYGANAYGTTIESGGVEILDNYALGVTGHPLNYVGGHQSGGTVENGGVLIATSGASLEAMTIKSGGEVVLEDQHTSGFTAEKGAIIAFTEVANNTKAIGNIVSDFTQTVYSGGTAIGTLIVEGIQIVSSGGRAKSSIVRSGGKQIVEAAGQASGTVISAQGSQTAYGKVNKATIKDGGVQILSAGSVARDTTISSGGVDIVGPGATATGIKISRGGILNLVGGRATKITVEKGGLLEAADVILGMTVRSSLVNQSYRQTVQRGGTVIDTTVSGSVQSIDKGGRALNTRLLSGTQEVEGYAANTSVVKSGIETVSGGTAVGTALVNGGVQVVGRKGISQKALVSVGGIQQVDSGGVARGTTVLSGGEIMYNGGTIIGAQLQSGGIEAVRTTVDHIKVTSGVTLAVLPGGIVKNSVIEGGTEIISAYANTSNNIFATNVVFRSGGTLSIQKTGPNVVVTASLSGFGAGSKLDLIGFKFVSGEKFTFVKGSGNENTLSITDGAMKASVTLFGQYVAAGFDHVGDGIGGTLITYTAPTQSHVGLTNPHH